MATRKRTPDPAENRRSAAAREGRGKPQVLLTLTTEARDLLRDMAERESASAGHQVSMSAVVVRLILDAADRGK